jgi:hypothetical protein
VNFWETIQLIISATPHLKIIHSSSLFILETFSSHSQINSSSRSDRDH